VPLPGPLPGPLSVPPRLPLSVPLSVPAGRMGNEVSPPGVGLCRLGRCASTEEVGP
jgi:hypothetical protein